MLIQLALSLPAEAATLSVCSTCAYTTVQAAVTAAVAGDTVQIEAGTYDVAGVSITKALSVVGRGPASTVLRVTSGTGVTVGTTAPVRVEGVAFVKTNGYSALSSSNSAFDVTIVNVEASGFGPTCNGGIIDLQGGGNAKVAIDGLYLHDATCRGLHLRGVLRPSVTGQPASAYAVVSNSLFERIDDGGAKEGSAVFIENSAVQFVGCSFVDNTADDGGAVALRSDPVAVLIEDSEFVGNSAVQVAGALSAPGGGAQHQYLEVRRTRFEANSSPRGGAFQQSGAQTTAWWDNTFVGNTASEYGGAVVVEQNSSGKITMRRNRFCGNTATQYGGAVYLNQAGSIASSYQFSNNVYVANHAGLNGGAFSTSSTAFTSSNELIMDNTGGGNGAGVRVYMPNGTSVFRNAVVAENAPYGISAPTGGITPKYGDWFGNSPGNTDGPFSLDTTNSKATSTFFAYSADGNCENDDFRMAMGNPAIDAGDPSLTDLDGSRSDVGPWGGPFADPAWWADGDKDGTRWVYDCDDTNAAVVGAQKWLRDADNDGYGTSATFVNACVPPAGYVSGAQPDCDDANAAVSPGDPELCNGLDDDCDGLVDDLPTQIYYRDADADGFGDPSLTQSKCAQPSGYVSRAGDCNDGNAQVHTGAPETCDALDRDCDGHPTSGAVDAKSYRPDNDADGYASSASAAIAACVPPSGYAEPVGDCDDGNALRFPSAVEQCNSVDDDCDSSIDEGVVFVDWYADGDGDGFGSGALAPITDCAAPAGRVANADDCADANPFVNPNATEVCNGLDDDCDARTDVGAADAVTWYVDADDDGFGGATTTTACSQPAGYAGVGGDCDDGTNLAYPDAPEDCAAADRDCDGQPTNDAFDAQTWWADLDYDGYGDPASEVVACAAPDDHVVASTADCDDASDVVAPGAPEQCGDATDADCDGLGGPDDDDDGDTLSNQLELYWGSDGCVGDSDGDGLSDVEEWGSDPSGVPANWDGDALIDAADSDDDDDGIPTKEEGTGDLDLDGDGNWQDKDADGDGLLDVQEGTADEDGDGIPNFLDPAGADADTDLDGLPDAFETANGLEPFQADSDGDGLSDGVEASVTDGLRNTDGDEYPDALDEDDDGDGVPTRDEDLDGDGDYEEHDEDGDGTPGWLDADEPTGDTGDTGTADVDTDGDGIPDDVEGTGDADGDGVPNAEDDDSDGDGASDLAEGAGDRDGDGIPDFLDAGATDDAAPPVPPALCGCATGRAGGVALAPLFAALLLRRRRALR